MRKLGRIKPHAAPRLKFADYLEAGATAPPEKVYRRDEHFRWQILGNGPDPSITINPVIAAHGVGNCVPCRALHAIQHAYISANKTPPAFTGDDSLALYSQVTPYDLRQTNAQGENPTDQGTDPTAMDTFWRTHGIRLPDGSVDKLAGYLDIHPQHVLAREIGIWEFDGLGCGLELTESAEYDHIWQIKPNDPVVGGHEIFLFSYDAVGFGINSWGELLRMNVGYLNKQCDQLTVYLSEDQIKRSGISDTGFNYDKLKQDFERLVP